MEMENNHKKKDIAIRNELQFRLDESEALLESVLKENKAKDKKIAEQMALLQELREIRDNSVAFAEYETLKDKYDKTYHQLSQTKDANQSLNKQLESDAKELETLFKCVDRKTQELHTLKTKMSDLALKCREKDNELQALKASKESMRDMARDLEKERLENVKLNELLNIFSEEKLKQSDLNISVDDFNQSLNGFVTSFNGSSVGESMDCVVNIKLQELETTLEDKCRQLNDKTSENEEMAKQVSQMEAFLVEKCSQYESIQKEVSETTEKFDLLKANCSELEARVDHLSAEYLDLQLEKDNELQALNASKESMRDMARDLEKERLENVKLNELLNIFREEKLKQSDLNISVDDLCRANEAKNQIYEIMKREMDSIIEEKIVLETQLKEEILNGVIVNVELQEMQAIVDKLKREKSSLVQILSEEQNKRFNKRDENIRYNSSKVSVENITPTKMFKRKKGNDKTWTPNKK